MSAPELEDPMKVDGIGHYERLGITQQADNKEIKKAYRSKAKELHPDKNKDDPDAARKFDAVKKAYEILLDPKARLAYDSLLNVKQEREARYKELDQEIQDMKTKLEKREEFARVNAVRERQAKKQLEDEVKRLRADGRKRQLLEDDRADPGALNEESERPTKAVKLDKSAVVTVKWKKKHGQLEESKLRATFEGFGGIDAVILKEDKAVINFQSSSSARAAYFSHGSAMDEALGIKVKLIWTGGAEESGAPSETEKVQAQVASEQPPGQAGQQRLGETTAGGDDYESITMMNMRRAAERQRLIAQMEAEDEAE